jgi:hypothetical protein
VKKGYFRSSVISRTGYVLFASLLATVVYAHQNAKREATVKSARIDAFIANASTAIPEVSADLFIKIAQSNLLFDRQKRIELLEEAFRRSGDVQEKTRRKISVRSVRSTT